MIGENEDARGMITMSGSIMEVQNALVEEMYTSNSRTGYLLISYADPGENDMINIELLQLNIGWETILINQFGDNISLCSITKGTYVNATFSAMMTRSIPPPVKRLPGDCHGRCLILQYKNRPDSAG
ncbi:hypothetical protein [Lacrimispora defluvii]|uniref:Uncharacterized protein n=1 Tax=Lacrimispora defluvii TaxID=2719233 RepID=A0ABX1VUG5_9FIRM|nr:hypothetical protein [Lacrimispora defluvii]NNJ31680.1 hypothetical protein [Lacrimispora defluvii]